MTYTSILFIQFLASRSEQFARLAFMTADLVERHAKIRHLLLQLLAVRCQYQEELAQLRRGVSGRLVHVDQLLDLRQRQTQPLATQSELESGTVALRID